MRVAFAVMLAAFAVAYSVAARATETLQPLVAAIVEYRWRVLVPHWVVEHRVTRAPASFEWKHRSVDYALPDFDFVSRRIGVLPHFECKYADFWLPNSCTTRWRDVYVDVPVAVVRHDRLDVDVPRWRTPGEEAVVDVPHVEWTEETLVVSLPALAARGCADRQPGCAR